MPPKRSRKRKINKECDAVDDNASLTPPDPATWPGWVEMESEPAFFNVMLKEMGVSGIKIQEVIGLEDDLLELLPRPVKALIFLFRYKDSDQAAQAEDATCPSHVWFANQIPDYACASVALLNIVNNISGLHMGKELRDFRHFTMDMDPMSRGDAIDSFDFVKHIHNSFARGTDLLVADMNTKQKAARAKKRQALAKARKTREAKKAGSTPLKEKSTNAGANPIRISAREQSASRRAVVTLSRESSPLSDPPDSDSDFETAQRRMSPVKDDAPRRSERKPKPQRHLAVSTVDNEEWNNEGFHFIAYMPIQGRVWKLDGLNSFPQDVGEVDCTTNGDWIKIIQPALQARMVAYEDDRIEFNLMAVVRDPAVGHHLELVQNINKLRKIETMLDSILEDWRALPEVDTSQDAINSASVELDVAQLDIDAADPVKLEASQDLEQLVKLRRQTIIAQAPLRQLVRDALEGSRRDNENARHMRHDYGGFVRSWLAALVDEEVLADLLDRD